MRPIKRTFQVLFISLFALTCAEVGARLLVDPILKKSPVFRLDPVVGWKPIRSSDLAQGSDLEGGHKLLILGDSFIFGEGVRLENRFDRRMKDAGFPDTVVSLGVSGYSTDQEMLAAQEELSVLQAGDTVVLATFGDDFRGLLSHYFAGRPKPQYRLEGGKLRLIAPTIGLLDILRERSYLVRMLKKLTASSSITFLNLGEDKLSEAGEVYHQLLIQYLVPAMERGVKIIVVFHGQDVVDQDFGPGAGDSVSDKMRLWCQQLSFEYLAIGHEFDFKLYRQSNSVHWNEKGHQKFAKLLMRACDKSNNQLHLSQKESR